MEIKRGDICYIEIPHAIGHEMMKDRPGVIVSCDALNFTSQVVAVVYLTGQPQAERPYHVEVKSIISARHGKSTAICEHIYTVDKVRVGKRMGRCTEEELAAIDDGILLTMGLGEGKYRGPMKRPAGEACKATEEPEQSNAVFEPLPLIQPNMELAIVQVERDTYKRLYESLLDRMSMERRALA